MPLQSEKIHTRVWQQGTINANKSGEKGDLLRREMMCSPWETPLCCTDTRRRFSVLGKSVERITRVKGKLPAHVTGFPAVHTVVLRSYLLWKWFRSVDTHSPAPQRAWHTPGGWTLFQQRGSEATADGELAEVTSAKRNPHRSCLILADRDCLIKKLW